MKQVIAKCYAAFYPANANSFRAVGKAGAQAIGKEEPWLFLEEDLLRISWEGVYFPLDEILGALANSLPQDAEGKLDYLDLEDWTLTRHIFQPKSDKEAFSVSTRGLNQILDYSGH